MQKVRRDEDFEKRIYDLSPNKFTGPFDIWAKRAICVVQYDRDIRWYDKWICGYAEATLRVASDTSPDIDAKDRLLAELKDQLLPRIEHWRGAARKYARECAAQRAQEREGFRNSECTALNGSEPPRQSDLATGDPANGVGTEPVPEPEHLGSERRRAVVDPILKANRWTFNNWELGPALARSVPTCR